MGHTGGEYPTRRPETARGPRRAPTTTTPRPRPRRARDPRRTARTRAPRSWRARGPRSGRLPAPVLGRAGADHPGRRLEPRGPGVARLPGAGVPGFGLDSAGARHRHLRLRRAGLPAGRARRAAQPAARHDDAHLAGDRGRVRRVVGRDAWHLRGRRVVGAGHPHHRHEPRPLDRDALDHAGAGRAFGAGRAAARLGGASDRRPAPRSCRSAPCASATSSWCARAPACPPTGRWPRAPPTSTSR